MYIHIIYIYIYIYMCICITLRVVKLCLGRRSVCFERCLIWVQAFRQHGFTETPRQAGKGARYGMIMDQSSWSCCFNVLPNRRPAGAIILEMFKYHQLRSHNTNTLAWTLPPPMPSLPRSPRGRVSCPPPSMSTPEDEFAKHLCCVSSALN